MRPEGARRNSLSIRKGTLENAALSVLQHHLFTEAHARLFVETFNREMARINGNQVDGNRALKDRLAIVDNELANLSANMLSGVLSPTLAKLLSGCEAEKGRSGSSVGPDGSGTACGADRPAPGPDGDVCTEDRRPARAPVRWGIRSEAAALMGRLIESVTIYPDGAKGPEAEAEVVSKVSELAAFALNDNAAPKGGVSSSMALVAGVGFEPTTFRL